MKLIKCPRCDYIVDIEDVDECKIVRRDSGFKKTRVRDLGHKPGKDDEDIWRD